MTSMNTTRAAGLIATAALVASGAGLGIGSGADGAVATPGAEVAAGHHEVVHFTATRETMHQVDLPPTGDSAGDQTDIGGKIASGNVRGYTSAQCVTVTSEDHAIAQCQVDLLLTAGTIVTVGTSTDLTPGVALAVAGGTGVYSGVSGSGRLTPTSAGSKVVLHLTGGSGRSAGPAVAQTRATTSVPATRAPLRAGFSGPRS
jgi:hypothetical protein